MLALTNEKDWNGEVKPVFQMSCGRTYPAEFWTPEELEREHGRCRVCAIVEGRSRATVLTQQQVADLFALGIDDRRSGTNHLSSANGILIHYSTLEAIRLKDGKVIENSQCWNAGFASCPSVRHDARLPLSTFSELIGWGSNITIRDIELLEVGKDWDGPVLFKYSDRYFLFGHDELAPYLCELPIAVNSVEMALDALIPEAVHAAIAHGDFEVKRQGDIFLVPAAPTKEESEHVSTKARFKKNAVTQFERRLVRPRIFDTNHSAGEVLDTGEALYVRGTIRHANRDHKPLNLGKQWHRVYKNTALLSVRVPRRGGRGGFD